MHFKAKVYHKAVLGPSRIGSPATSEDIAPLSPDLDTTPTQVVKPKAQLCSARQRSLHLEPKSIQHNGLNLLTRSQKAIIYILFGSGYKVVIASAPTFMRHGELEVEMAFLRSSAFVLLFAGGLGGRFWE